MAKSKSRGKTRPSPAGSDHELIVIDEKQELIFESEEELSQYFDPTIQLLESEYQGLRDESDFSDEEQLSLEEEHLEPTLDDPDEVWLDTQTEVEIPLHIFISNRGGLHYVVIAYVSDEDGEPTFVLTHFPTKSQKLVAEYRRQEMVFSKTALHVQEAVVDGDALGDGDPLAMGLFVAMTKVRSEKDIPMSDFAKFADLREDAIENPDEIWRKNDMEGNVLVSFIKEYPDHETKELVYVVVTLEDESSNVHALLFSFPTTDRSLVDRYRQGENLQAEEVVQENSH